MHDKNRKRFSSSPWRHINIKWFSFHTGQNLHGYASSMALNKWNMKYYTPFFLKAYTEKPHTINLTYERKGMQKSISFSEMH